MSNNLKKKAAKKQKLSISIIALVISIVVFVVSMVFMIVRDLLFIGILWAIIIIIIINSCLVSHYKKETRKYCQKCGKKLSKEEYTVFPGKVFRSGDIMKMKVQFGAKCGNCYNKQSFYKKFDLVSLEDGTDYNCLDKAECYISALCK